MVRRYLREIQHPLRGLNFTKIKNIRRSSATIDLSNIGAYSTGSFTITVNGASPGDVIVVDRPAALSGGLIVSGWNIQTSNTFTIYISNITASAIDSGPVNFTWFWIDIT